MKKIPKMVKENLLKNLIIDWVDLMYDCMMYSLLLSLLNGVHKIAETAVSLSEDIGRSFAFKDLSRILQTSDRLSLPCYFLRSCCTLFSTL